MIFLPSQVRKKNCRHFFGTLSFLLELAPFLPTKMSESEGLLPYQAPPPQLPPQPLPLLQPQPQPPLPPQAPQAQAQEEVVDGKNALNVAQITEWRRAGVSWKLIQKRLGIKSNNRNKLLRWRIQVQFVDPVRNTASATSEEVLDAVSCGAHGAVSLDDPAKAALLNMDQVTEWRLAGVPWALIQKMVGIKDSNRNKLTRWRRTMKFQGICSTNCRF